MATKKSANETVTIRQLDRRLMTVHLIGESGLYFNSMSAKAMRDLLMPPKKKTSAEKAMSLKHNPREEYRNSIYARPDGSDTLLGFPAAGFKAAMANAALVTEGVRKSDIQKLLYVEGEQVPVYGVPWLRCDVVRSADMNRTPDVRTRAFVPEWATTLTISYTAPNLTEQAVFNLLSNAGQACGIGDFRQEKGRGNFGRFKIVNKTDPDYKRLVKETSFAKQEKAMSEALPYDAVSDELLAYFDDQLAVREINAA